MLTIHSKYKPFRDKSNNIKYEFATELEAGSELGLAQDLEIVLENGVSQEPNLEGYYKDDYTFVGLNKYTVISDKEIPDEFNVKMNVKEISSYDIGMESTIEGPWEFDFNVKKSMYSK